MIKLFTQTGDDRFQRWLNQMPNLDPDRMNAKLINREIFDGKIYNYKHVSERDLVINFVLKRCNDSVFEDYSKLKLSRFIIAYVILGDVQSLRKLSQVLFLQPREYLVLAIRYKKYRVFDLLTALDTKKTIPSVCVKLDQLPYVSDRGDNENLGSYFDHIIFLRRVEKMLSEEFEKLTVFVPRVHNIDPFCFDGSHVKNKEQFENYLKFVPNYETAVMRFNYDDIDIPVYSLPRSVSAKTALNLIHKFKLPESKLLIFYILKIEKGV